ncbi:MAG: GNAT family N-acetyltransferase [Crocosphaera sp.]
MYTLKRLNKFGTAFFYAPFTFPRFRCQLQNLQGDGNIIAIGVSNLDKPIGLAMAEIYPEDNSAEILSIFVAPAYRRQKIGIALLTRLEEELYKRGCTKAKLFCQIGEPTWLPLERLIQRCNWSFPQPWDIVCESDWDTISKAPWLQRKFHLPRDMMIFPWVEITDHERIVIQKTYELEPWFEDGANPFENEENFEPLNSLGLRYQEKVVGWMLTERVASDSIYYKCMFVRKDLQRLGRGIALFVNAIKIQYEAKIPKGIWRVHLENPAMLRFVKKHMMPYLTSFEEVSCSYKQLISP